MIPLANLCGLMVSYEGDALASGRKIVLDVEVKLELLLLSDLQALTLGAVPVHPPSTRERLLLGA
jgi:hypothetical protein